MTKTKKLSIVIPAYNEDQTVEEVIRKVREVRLPNLIKEIILVNDGSTDKTKEKIAAIVKGQSEIKFYNSIINLGKGAAVRIGLTKCTGDIIIIQDADLELDPNEYLKIITPILNGQSKVVYGSRFSGTRNQINWKTLAANKLITLLTNVIYGYHLTDMETAYKAFTSNVIRGMRFRALEFEFEAEITAQICKRGIPILEVPISYRPRTAEQGKKLRLTDGLEAIYTLIRCKWR